MILKYLSDKDRGASLDSDLAAQARALRAAVEGWVGGWNPYRLRWKGWSWMNMDDIPRLLGWFFQFLSWDDSIHCTVEFADESIC